MTKTAFSVLDFGADPTGVDDSTKAFVEASDRARKAHLALKVLHGLDCPESKWGELPPGAWLQPRQDATRVLVADNDLAIEPPDAGAPLATVLVPEGTYRLQPSSPGTTGITWHSIHWIGEASHGEARTVLKPVSPEPPDDDQDDSGESDTLEDGVAAGTAAGAPVTALIRTTGRVTLQDIAIDCDNEIDAGLILVDAIGARLRHVSVQNARKVGVSISEAEWLRAERLSASVCPIGISVYNSNGASFIDLRAIDCGIGIEVRGSEDTKSSAILSMQGISIEVHKKTKRDKDSPMFLVDRVQGGTFGFNYLHGGRVGIRVSGKSRSATFTGGGAPVGQSLSYHGQYNQVNDLSSDQEHPYFIDLENAHHCTFIGFAPASGIVRVNADRSAQNQFVGLGHSQGSKKFGNMPIAFYSNQISKPWIAYERDGRLQAFGPPPDQVGWWPTGQVIENIDPDYDRPMGWVFRRPNGRWLALPTITRPAPEPES